MKKRAWVLLASLLAASPAGAQSQYQATFEVGVGYTRPAVQRPFDMASLLVQGEDYFLETGIGLRVNGGVNENNVLSWLVRAGVRAILLGNTTVYAGGEFSLHTNATIDKHGETKALIGVAALFGVSHPVTDHFEAAVHVYPLAFEFGGRKTIATIGTAEVGAHIL